MSPGRIWKGVWCSILTLVACGEPKPIVVDFQEPATVMSPPRAPAQSVRLAVAAMTSPHTAFDGYVGFKHYFEAALGRPVALVFRRAYEDVENLLRTREIDVAFVCSGSYTRLADTQSVKLLAVPRIRGSTLYHSLFLIRDTETATSVRALSGRPFGLSDPLSHSGHAYPYFRIRQLGLDTRTYFSKAVLTHGHDNSIFALKKGRVDAVAVDSLVYDFYREREPDVVRGLAILERSPAFGSPPVVARADLDPDLDDLLRRALLSMHTDVYGKKVLDDLRIEAFVEGNDRDYDFIRQINGALRNP